MIRLSININKVALVRNARGSDWPNLIQVALDCERFGAQGITVHPRPDERHIRFDDLAPLQRSVKTEFNVEGYPSPAFLERMEALAPHQVTLVPDPPDALTSSEGWNTQEHAVFLRQVVERLQAAGCRVSLFLEPREDLVRAALETGTDRVEFYTGPYAVGFAEDRASAIAPYVKAAGLASSLGLGCNAGHDLNRDNLAYWQQCIPETMEVSIGHALWVDAWYLGMENTIRLYRRALGHQPE